MAGAAMAQPFDQIGAAIPGGIMILLGDVGAAVGAKIAFQIASGQRELKYQGISFCLFACLTGGTSFMKKV